jgi:CO dehydrogenase nickel-insertion accessory protein CooC1
MLLRLVIMVSVDAVGTSRKIAKLAHETAFKETVAIAKALGIPNYSY